MTEKRNLFCYGVKCVQQGVPEVLHAVELPANSSFVYGGRQLNDGEALADLGVGAKAVIDVNNCSNIYTNNGNRN